jgi:hypothetical protein
VREAWEQARDAGAYTFATNLTQVTYPARSLANAGRSPQRDELHMAGTIDQPAPLFKKLDESVIEEECARLEG